MNPIDLSACLNLKRALFRGFIALLCLSGESAKAASLTAGGLIVSVNEFTGSSNAPRWIREYTSAGTRLQTLSRVPAPGGTVPSTEAARDLLYGADGDVYLFNGTFTPTLSRFNVATSTWTQTTAPGWSTVNNTTYGGIDQVGQTIFVSDMRTFGPGQEPQGIVRFDLAGGGSVRIAPSIEPIDFDLGLDGILYALTGTNTVLKLDPLTGASLGSVTVPSLDYRGIAVADDGSFFLTSSSGLISRFSSSGALLKSLSVTGEFLGDIDIDPAGRIAVGTANSGNVVVTNAVLDAFTKFRATDSTSGGSTFVGWVTPIPEPGTCLFGLALVGICGGSRRRRR